MSYVESSNNELCAIYADVGTTNTRVWLLHGADVVARARRQVGVRDSAQAGHSSALRTALGELLGEVQARQTKQSGAPLCIVAAGMISSPLGLIELAHVTAPAGVQELAAAAARFAFPEISPLSFLLVPGVRSGADQKKREAAPNAEPGLPDQISLEHLDVMRGEETLCIGLRACGVIETPALVITLGSHWKAITVAADGRIQSSTTTLAGEMIQAVLSETILSGSLDREWPNTLAPQWLRAGMAEQRRSGLARALFCVRLLELQGHTNPDERFAYLLGAFVAGDLDALVASGVLRSDTRVVISGAALAAEAWALALAPQVASVAVLSERETERGFLAGLTRILNERLLNDRTLRAQLAGADFATSASSQIPAA